MCGKKFRITKVEFAQPEVFNSSIYLIVTIVLALLMSPVLSADESRLGTWEPIGPNVASVYGSVTDPSDPDTITILTEGTWKSTVFRTEDGAHTWEQIGMIDEGDLIDMCTYDFDRMYAFRGNAWFSTMDGGETWTEYYIYTSYGSLSSACLHPSDPDIIFAAGCKYIHDPFTPTYCPAFFKSTDGGASWSKTYLPGGLWESFITYRIAVSPTNPDICYFVGESEEYMATSAYHLYRSLDGGISWEEVLSYNSSFPLYTVAIDPVNPNRVYAGGYNLLYSDDGGDTWSVDSTVYGVRDIGVDPMDASKVVVAGTKNIYVSDDQAQTFTAFGNLLEGNQARIYFSPSDTSKITISKLGGGLYRSLNGGATWVDAHNTLGNGTINALAIAKSQPRTVAVNLKDLRKLKVTYNGGLTWKQKTYDSDWGDNLNAIHIHSTNPDVMLVIDEHYGVPYKDRFFRTEDGGTSWSQVDDWFVFGECIAGDPTDPDILYAGGTFDDPSTYYHFAVCKSYDGGLTWPDRAILSSGSIYSSRCIDITVSSIDPSVVYAAGVNADDNSVWRSNDGGATWVDVTNGLTGFPGYNKHINAVWVSPQDPETVVVTTTYDGVFKSVDGGAGWTQVFDPGGFAYGLGHFAPMNEMYVRGPDNKIYHSLDDGDTWQLFINDLPLDDVYHFEVDGTNGLVYMGTWGSGVIRYTHTGLPHLAAGADEFSERTGSAIDMGLYAGAANANRKYLIVGGASGTTPGMPLPGGHVTLPINWDLFSDIQMAWLNMNLFMNFMGNLNAFGNASARLNLPMLPTGTAGLTLNFAYCCNSPFDFVSNAVSIEIIE